MRLGAYSGVMAARIYERQRDESPGGAAPRGASPARSTGAAVNNDPHLVTKLAADGWLEHRTEQG